MDDPKRQAWMYVVVGAVAVVAAIYFLATDGMGGGSFGILDWVILGMGVVAIWRGVRGFADLKRGEAPPADPGSSTTFRRKQPPKDPS